MAADVKVLFISVPGLSQADINSGSALFMQSLAEDGDFATLAPCLPATSCTSHANMFTGSRAQEHGMVADAFYESLSHEVLSRPQYAGVVKGAKLWDLLKARESRALTALLFFEQTKYARADIVITPDPVVMEDGGLISHCYSRPRSLFAELERKLQWFDLESFEGRDDLQYSMRWISGAAEYVLKEFNPRLTMVRFPHIEYAMTKYGPGSREFRKILSSFDAFLGHLVQVFKKDGDPAAVVVASPYSSCAVDKAVYINRELRKVGLLSVQHVGGREVIDFEDSKAFAITDYQVAHVYCRDESKEQAAELLGQLGEIQAVLGAAEKHAYGLNHPRSGEFVLLAKPDSWFTYAWWFEDYLAPSFPRQGSRAKPGCDPLELFMEQGIGFADMPTDTSLVKGSHGLTPEFGGQAGVLLCDEYAAQELRINRLELTEVFTLLGHILR